MKETQLLDLSCLYVQYNMACALGLFSFRIETKIMDFIKRNIEHRFGKL